jgi:hypothetical protein
MFVSVRECNNLFSTATEFLNVWQDGAKNINILGGYGEE